MAIAYAQPGRRCTTRAIAGNWTWPTASAAGPTADLSTSRPSRTLPIEEVAKKLPSGSRTSQPLTAARQRPANSAGATSASRSRASRQSLPASRSVVHGLTTARPRTQSSIRPAHSTGR
jgi:hypothetical protein